MKITPRILGSVPGVDRLSVRQALIGISSLLAILIAGVGW